VVALAAAVLLGTAAQASAAVVIDLIRYDPPGPDNRTPASLRAEYVRLVNNGTARVVIGGWTLRDAAGHIYRIPNGFALLPHSAVNIRTGSGQNRAHQLYWGMGNYVWNNDGDTARLRRANRTQADACSYPGGGSGVANC
jgi:lamin tail-like protein